ncbi:MAG: hypothetical protein RL090_1709 [Bacteroidota bacterium]|jgi:hypothetical protein
MELIASASIFFMATILMAVFFHVRYLNQYSYDKPLDYRAIRNGNWSDLATWEVNDNGQWVRPSEIPNGSHVTSFIPHDICVDLNQEVVLNNLFIEDGGSLNIVSGKVGIVKSFDQGTLSCNGTLKMGTSEIVGDGDVVVGPGSSLYCQMLRGNKVANFRVSGKQSIGSGVKFFTF